MARVRGRLGRQWSLRGSREQLRYMKAPLRKDLADPTHGDDMNARTGERQSSMARRPKIFATYLHPSSFVIQDFETLEAAFDVHRCAVPRLRRGIPGLGALASADILLCWFGSVRFLPYTLFARLLGKPVIVIAGGYDVAAESSIDYGNMRGGLTRLFGRLLFRLATLVVAFSEASRRELERNAGVPRARSRLILLGFDVERPSEPVASGAKRAMVLSVGIIDETTIYRKGFLTLARMSKLLPDVPVVFVGRHEPAARDKLEEVAGANVRFTGFVSAAELDTLYRDAAVYAQPSVHEGFGCAVAEAMLYDCVPVVSDRGSLPEVVGSCGYFAPPDDPTALADVVRQALTRGVTGDETPRQRIQRLFPVAARRTHLLALIEEVLAVKGKSTSPAATT